METNTRGMRHETADRAMPSQRKEGRRTRARYGFCLGTALPLVLLALFEGLPARAFVALPPRTGRWQSTEATKPLASRRRCRGSSAIARESKLEKSTAAASIGGCRYATVLSMGGSVEEEWPFHKSRSVASLGYLSTTAAARKRLQTVEMEKNKFMLSRLMYVCTRGCQCYYIRLHFTTPRRLYYFAGRITHTLCMQ